MLKIISLNIEHSKHLDQIIAFFKEHKFDVILLQEVLESDIPKLEQTTGMKSIFTPMNFFYNEDPEEINQVRFGLLTLSNFPILHYESAFYNGDGNELPHLKWGENPNLKARMLLITEIQKENEKYCLLNTHFTWTPNGQPSEQQFKDLDVLLQHLSKIPEFILCGDLNAPRGTAIFDTLAKKYKDNIPAHITTTIDPRLHKAGPLNLVVDGLFTTPQYQAESVEIADGLSDHCAILATLSLRA